MNEATRRRIIINPHNAVTVHESLTRKRQPLESTDTWIKRNTKLIDAIGLEAWLQLLLDVLADGGFSNPENPSGTFLDGPYL